MNKVTTIEDKATNIKENQKPTKIKNKILSRLKENYIKHNIKNKNKKLKALSCSTNKTNNKYQVHQSNQEQRKNVDGWSAGVCWKKYKLNRNILKKSREKSRKFKNK